jgi:hypothetical protein
VSIPVLEQQDQFAISTAELLVGKQPSETLVPPQAVPHSPQSERGSRLNEYIDLVDATPTRKLTFRVGGRPGLKGSINLDDMPAIDVPMMNREANN